MIWQPMAERSSTEPRDKKGRWRQKGNFRNFFIRNDRSYYTKCIYFRWDRDGTKGERLVCAPLSMLNRPWNVESVGKGKEPRWIAMSGALKATYISSPRDHLFPRGETLTLCLGQSCPSISRYIYLWKCRRRSFAPYNVGMIRWPI